MVTDEGCERLQRKRDEEGAGLELMDLQGNLDNVDNLLLTQVKENQEGKHKCLEKNQIKWVLINMYKRKSIIMKIKNKEGVVNVKGKSWIK